MSDLLANLALGFGVAFSPMNLLFVMIGALVGTLIGVLPGIGSVASIAMLLPITFGLPPVGVNEASFLNIPVLNALIPQLDNNVFFRFALIAIVVYTAAFVCEALRAGIRAVSS